MTSMTQTDRLTPYRVAEETFVIPWHLPAPPVGFFPMNSLIIRGKQPIIIDTGPPAIREAWLEAAWSIVDPADVRWIFVSHDDRDHSGNLLAVREACPNATLLTTWFAVGRMFEAWAMPLHRNRVVNPGETLDIGDRTLLAIRPPVFDNPTTRALIDTRTGVFWSVDTFATNVAAPVAEASELSIADFTTGQMIGSRLVAPWHTMLDEGRYRRYVDAVERLPMRVAVGAHTPAIRGGRLEAAFETLRELPTMDAWADYTQDDLDMWMFGRDDTVATDEYELEAIIPTQPISSETRAERRTVVLDDTPARR
jgi:hypothetical protein